ncbi:MAG TPA: sarcosine oxidase subunit gamma family protein [Steroidobacteraceae bacterium]|nr:sarcosine oxidase subunit gamma family protein [Steroidobacteraceae bacterium]
MHEAAARSAPSFPPTAWMNVLAPATRIAFYGDRAARAAAESVFPISPADAVCRAHVDGARASLWLGPDEYLLIAPTEPGAAALIAQLTAAIGALPHALVDVSHRQVAFEIHGPQAARILNGACPLDLEESRFPVGACTRTVFAKAEIVLWRTHAEAFRVEAWRSFARYVAELLAEIAQDYGDHPP